MTAIYYLAGLAAGYFLARARMSVERHEAECLHRQVIADIEKGRRMMEYIERTPIRTQYYSEPKWN